MKTGWLALLFTLLASPRALATCVPSVAITANESTKELLVVQRAIEARLAARSTSDSADLELRLALKRSSVGSPPNVREEWCVTIGASSRGVPVALELPNGLCASGAATRLGTELPAPSAGALTDKVAVPIATAVERWARNQRTLSVKNLSTAAILVGPHGERRNLPAATIEVRCYPLVDASLVYGDCSLPVPAAAREIEVPGGSRVYFTVNGTAQPVVDVSSDKQTEFRIAVSTAGIGPFELRCGGDVELSPEQQTAHPTLVASARQEWRWTVGSEPGIATFHVTSSSGAKSKPELLTIQLELAWWKRLWVQVAGAVAALAALIEGISKIRDFFTKKSKEGA